MSEAVFIQGLTKRFGKTQALDGISFCVKRGELFGFLGPMQDVYRGFAGFQSQGRGLGFLQGDITSIDPVEEFDFALLMDVIEHIPDDKSFVDHVGR
ncbi:MAG: hypothetical protein R6X05_09505, partial [Desulfobacterales bacterium]